MSEEDYDNFFKFGGEFNRDPKKRSGYKFSHFGNDVYGDVRWWVSGLTGDLHRGNRKHLQHDPQVDLCTEQELGHNNHSAPGLPRVSARVQENHNDPKKGELPLVQGKWGLPGNTGQNVLDMQW